MGVVSRVYVVGLKTETPEERISNWFSGKVDPKPNTARREIECLRSGLRDIQKVHYYGVRYHIFHLDRVYDHGPCGRFRSGGGRSRGSSAGYPNLYLPSEREYEVARNWLSAGDRASGRSYLMALCFLEKALDRIEQRISYFGHRSGRRGSSDMYSHLRSMTWNNALMPRFVFSRDSEGYYLAASTPGATEIVSSR